VGGGVAAAGDADAAAGGGCASLAHAPRACTCVAADGALAWGSGFAVRFADAAALLTAAFESRHTKTLLALPRAAQVLICAARGLAERASAARAHTAAFLAARAEERAGRATSGTFEGAAISFGAAATAAAAYKAVGGEGESAVAGYGSTSAAGVGVPIGALRDAFTRLCRTQLLAVVDARDFADLLDRLEASGLVGFIGRVGAGGSRASSGARGRMTSAGSDRVTASDAWANNALRINVAVADLDMAFGDSAFYKNIAADVRLGTV
jgi:hypothetical protein